MKFIVNTIIYSHILLDELSQPSDISLVGVSPGELIFEWSSVTHNCLSILYSIMMTSPGCGNCPTIVNSTTTTCLIDQMQTDEVRTCTFRVQGILCGNISGPSSEAAFRLQGTYVIINVAQLYIWSVHKLVIAITVVSR